MKTLSLREKSILAGLYLSKFDAVGLRRLGFDSFVEAFNVIGLALGVQPASVKNYRDEFDPLFPNKRKGWHKRAIRNYCKAVYDTSGSLGIEDFSKLLKQIIYREHDLDVLMEEVAKIDGGEDGSFAKRLITGQAAEQYFKRKYKEIDLFDGFKLEETTMFGCGFDFRLVSAEVFYGVEVKGMNESSGTIAMTNKEHSVASLLANRYFLFVVKNFREKPFYELHRNPLNEKLVFNRVAQRTTQISWTTKL
ncbi:MAG: protein NO VEIN domain-containing protein [Candidatus Binataceae bacterium]